MLAISSPFTLTDTYSVEGESTSLDVASAARRSPEEAVFSSFFAEAAAAPDAVALQRESVCPSSVDFLATASSLGMSSASKNVDAKPSANEVVVHLARYAADTAALVGNKQIVSSLFFSEVVPANIFRWIPSPFSRSALAATRASNFLMPRSSPTACICPPTINPRPYGKRTSSLPSFLRDDRAYPFPYAVETHLKLPGRRILSAREKQKPLPAFD
mmetsp:Transcript_31800/g.53828  ORF Transcript_31800/g.53828 Transcript_31800/m.53828 type:complete len:216 (-) Transcript_31800:481-1128(-)